MTNSRISKGEFTKLRRLKERETLQALIPIFKEHGWKKIQNIFFLNRNDWFWTLSLNTYLNAEITKVSLETKPMAIDPVLWNIMYMPENHRAPLSLRANGAFTCATLPVDEFIIRDNAKKSETICAEIASWLLGNFDKYCERISSRSFSSQIENHENQVKRGAYAISLVATLISEGNTRKAKEYSQAYENGNLKSVCEMTNHDGNSFHYHALKWLSENETTA